jgi:hypothetical protein
VNGATFTNGVVDEAFSADGANDYVQLPVFFTNVSHFTFAWWMKIDTFTHGDYMAAFCQATPGVPFQSGTFNFFTGNQPVGGFGFSGYWLDGSFFDLRTGIPFGTGDWKHLAVTYDGSSVRQYVDGRLFSSKSYSAKRLGAAFPLLLAKGYGFPSGATVSTYFDGVIDELSLGSRAKTPNRKVLRNASRGGLGPTRRNVKRFGLCDLASWREFHFGVRAQ